MKKNNLKDELKPNEITVDQKLSLRTRIISALVALVIIVPAIVFGGIPFFVVVLLVGGIGAWEIVHAAKRKYNPLLYVITILIVLLLATVPLIKSMIKDGSLGDWKLYDNFDTLQISAAVLIVGAILCMTMVLIDKNFEVRDACYIFTFGVILGLGLQSIFYLRYYPLYEAYVLKGVTENNTDNFLWSPCLILLIAGASLMSDTGAYFAGMLFGKNKINERISPKKTWEGFVGGVIFSMIWTLVFGLIMAFNNKPIIDVFAANRWYILLIIAVVMPTISPLGDFIFSSVKRYYNIKDFGNIMPGHGGVLDRIDSVIFASISAALIIIIANAAIGNAPLENLFV